MELGDSIIQDFLTNGVMSMVHNTMGTMGTTSLVLVVQVHFGLLMFLDMLVVPVVVFQEIGLRSILAGQVRSTDSSLVQDIIQANSRDSSSNRGIMAHPMREEDGRLGRGKVGHLEIKMLERTDKRKTYLAPAAQVVGEVK